MELYKWNGLVWGAVNGDACAYCPKHKGMELDVIDRYGRLASQHNLAGSITEISATRFVCPADEEQFEFSVDYFTLKRRYNAFQSSKLFKDLRIVDLDNVYTPILKVEPKPKDARYSVQVEIDETPQGKKMVIYAADRNNLSEKTQIFIDPQTDKLSFDGNDIHPNMIFSKVIAYFDDGKSAVIESGHGND